MQTKTSTENLAKNTKAVSENSYLPFILLIGMIGAIIFLDAVLPLGGLWFHTALLPQVGAWTLWPTHLLFPGWAVSSIITSDHPQAPPVVLGWEQVPFLFLAFALIFLLYLAALRYLPRSFTNCRSIIYSTLLLGLVYMLIPVVTSPDIFSYMSYARMGVIYHLNPLTTLPIDIRNDPTYIHIYWNTQPSAYGPMWIAISSLLQWLVLPFGAQALLPMLLALRLFGLAAHLCSTLLIWSISGHIQRQQGQIDMPKRMLATFAFAWNPLLLLEACVNAHNDVAGLLLILLALWFLVSSERLSMRSSLVAMGVFALATCVKLNVVVLLPLVLIFLWRRWGKEGILSLAIAALMYAGLIVLLYAPFWQGGMLLNVLHTNPTTFRNINTPVEFVFRLYNGLVARFGGHHPPVDGSRAESVTHAVSIGLFVVLYGWLCWQAIRKPQTLQTAASLVAWLALAWFLYCAFGTPWFWPWYLVPFFGLYALVAATSSTKISVTPLTLSLLAFSMLSIYCFYAWNFNDTFVRGLPDFRWSYVRGIWAWGIPLLSLQRIVLSKRKAAVLNKKPAE